METSKKIKTAMDKAIELNEKMQKETESKTNSSSQIPTPQPYFPPIDVSIKVAVEGIWQELRDIKLLLMEEI